MSNRTRTVWASVTVTVAAGTAAVCCLLVVFATPAVGAPLHGGFPNSHVPKAGFDWLNPFGPHGSALVGSTPTVAGPSELALDPATHTIYVTNGYNDNGPNAGGDTLSVIDARHCQAQDLSACKGPWPTIKVGNLPSSIAIDQGTDTVYVTSVGDDTVSVFNGATCNAMNTSGCGQTPATVPVGVPDRPVRRPGQPYGVRPKLR